MILLEDINAIGNEALEAMAFSWHSDGATPYVVQDKILPLSMNEAQAYRDAANTLYGMYETAAEYVIEHNLFEALDIPRNLIESIKKSFVNERKNHLYGRFDLSGGIDGKAIKLIEFNADTPTLLVESTLVQWMMLQKSGLGEQSQFNAIYEAIGKQFEKIAASKRGAFSPFLLSSVRDVAEESVTVKLLQKMADDRGILTHYTPLEDVVFSDNFVLDEAERTYDFWFKLYPWEDMLEYEGGMQTSLLNPAFTLLYQSKGILAILYRLFPDSPYLLESSFEPLKEKKYVKKTMFGREGANIEIVQNSKILNATDGAYSEYKAVYQEYVDFVRDSDGAYYQAGIFYAGEACGIGFRRGAEILDNMSQFIAHYVKSDTLIEIKNIDIPELEIYSSLRESAFRKDGSFIADSPKVVNLLLESDVEIKSILATKEYYEAFGEIINARDIPQKYLTTKEQMKGIVGHKIHHNCMMHGIRPRDVKIDSLGDEVLLLDGITSAENVGSIVRSCAALGVSSLAISHETPHPFNRRALRVAMGHSHLLKTYIYEDIKESIAAFQKRGYRVYAAEVSADSTPLSRVKVAEKWVLIMGHEGRGISSEILALCDEIVTIEMQEGIKSFNVGVAASLMMYQFKIGSL